MVARVGIIIRIRVLVLGQQRRPRFFLGSKFLDLLVEVGAREGASVSSRGEDFRQRLKSQ